MGGSFLLDQVGNAILALVEPFVRKVLFFWKIHYDSYTEHDILDHLRNESNDPVLVDLIHQHIVGEDIKEERNSQVKKYSYRNPKPEVVVNVNLFCAFKSIVEENKDVDEEQDGFNSDWDGI